MNLNEQILQNLQSEYALALANHKVLRQAYLEAQIAEVRKLIENDEKLREEMGLI